MTPDASFLRSVAFTPSASPRPSAQQMQLYDPQQQQVHQQMTQSQPKRRSSGGGAVATRAAPPKVRSGLSAVDPTRSAALASSSSAHPAHLYTNKNGIGRRALNPTQSHLESRMIEVATLADPAVAEKRARVDKAYAAHHRAQSAQQAQLREDHLKQLLALNAQDENAVVPLPQTGSRPKKRASTGGAIKHPAGPPAPLQHAPPPSVYLPNGTLILRSAANERRMSSGGPSSGDQPGYVSANHSARSSRAASPARRNVVHADTDMFEAQQLQLQPQSQHQQPVAQSDLHQALAMHAGRAPSSSFVSSYPAPATTATVTAPAPSPVHVSSFPSSQYPANGFHAPPHQSPVVSHTINGSVEHHARCLECFAVGSLR